MAISSRLAFILLTLSFVCVVCANRCAGRAATGGNFNASLHLSFTNAKHLSPSVSWWDAAALYPTSPDPQYCDNNKPHTYASSPWVCPTDNFGTTTNCPGGCDDDGACHQCGPSSRGNCHGEYFDCDYQSQLRWGTPTAPRNPALATNAKSGFAYLGKESQPVECSKATVLGELSHLNWAILENVGADTELSMELRIDGFAIQPLNWTWRIVHYETPDNACPEKEYPECCPEAMGFCQYDGDACEEGCHDVVGFYEVPYKEWHWLVTDQYGHGDQCYYNVTAWFQVSKRSLLCLPITTDNSTNPWVQAWFTSAEQAATGIPLYIKIEPGCEGTPEATETPETTTRTQTATQTVPVATTSRPPATTVPPTRCECDPCSECDEDTGLCVVVTICGECGECDQNTGRCKPREGMTCGVEKNGCFVCDATGQCVPNNAGNCSLGDNACAVGVCGPTGKCVPDPKVPVPIGRPCGSNINMCASSFCDELGRCVEQPAEEGTSCEVGDPNECVSAACDAHGKCVETVLENFPCKGDFLVDEKDNRTWCRQPICVGRECVMQNLPPGTNCTPPNATICELWQCNVRGECERNTTLNLCVPPGRSRRWVVAAGVAGGAFAIIALAALAFLAASRAAPLPAGAQADPAVPHMNNSPLYNPMLSVEGTNPLYATNP